MDPFTSRLHDVSIINNRETLRAIVMKRTSSEMSANTNNIKSTNNTFIIARNGQHDDYHNIIRRTNSTSSGGNSNHSNENVLTDNNTGEEEELTTNQNITTTIKPTSLLLLRTIIKIQSWFRAKFIEKRYKAVKQARQSWKSILYPNEAVVHSSLVLENWYFQSRKYTKIQRVMLILTTRPRLLMVNPSTKKIIKPINFHYAQTVATVHESQRFVISTPGHVLYCFTDCINSAAIWGQLLNGQLHTIPKIQRLMRISRTNSLSSINYVPLMTWLKIHGVWYWSVLQGPRLVCFPQYQYTSEPALLYDFDRLSSVWRDHKKKNNNRKFSLLFGSTSDDHGSSSNTSTSTLSEGKNTVSNNNNSSLSIHTHHHHQRPKLGIKVVGEPNGIILEFQRSLREQSILALWENTIAQTITNQRNSFKKRLQKVSSWGVNTNNNSLSNSNSTTTTPGVERFTEFSDMAVEKLLKKF
jgi:hypothetical protein